MPIEAMIAVLLGAFLHAAWNVMIRGAADPARDTVLIVVGAAALALCASPFVPLPAPASWPYLLASGVIHVVYFLLVASAYRHGEMSLVYPVMRGTAPALSALGAVLLFSEWPAAGGWIGIALICAGILLIAAESLRGKGFPARAMLAAVATALVVAVYTLIDGAGVRLSGNAAGYTGWVFVLTAAPLLVFHAMRNGANVMNASRSLLPYWRRALAGGAFTLGAYALALWAMTLAPIALVAALRETSVVFGTLLAALLLNERVRALRWVAIVMVCAGAAAIRFA